jgi:hypothetical protein
VPVALSPRTHTPPCTGTAAHTRRAASGDRRSARGSRHRDPSLGDCSSRYSAQAWRPCRHRLRRFAWKSVRRRGQAPRLQRLHGGHFQTSRRFPRTTRHRRGARRRSCCTQACRRTRSGRASLQGQARARSHSRATRCRLVEAGRSGRGQRLHAGGHARLAGKARDRSPRRHREFRERAAPPRSEADGDCFRTSACRRRSRHWAGVRSQSVDIGCLCRAHPSILDRARESRRQHRARRAADLTMSSTMPAAAKIGPGHGPRVYRGSRALCS